MIQSRAMDDDRLCAADEGGTAQGPRHQFDLSQQRHPDLAGALERRDGKCRNLVSAGRLRRGLGAALTASARATACRSAKRRSVSAVLRCRRRSRPGTSTCGPTGRGLPSGKGSVKEGEEIFLERCASCHGEFGEGAGRYPGSRRRSGHPEGGIAGQDDRLLLAVCLDAVRLHPAAPCRSAMRSRLTPDEVYALTAYLLNHERHRQGRLRSLEGELHVDQDAECRRASTTTTAKHPRSPSGRRIPA